MTDIWIQIQDVNYLTVTNAVITSPQVVAGAVTQPLSTLNLAQGFLNGNIPTNVADATPLDFVSTEASARLRSNSTVVPKKQILLTQPAFISNELKINNSLYVVVRSYHSEIELLVFDLLSSTEVDYFTLDSLFTAASLLPNPDSTQLFAFNKVSDSEIYVAYLDRSALNEWGSLLVTQFDPNARTFSSPVEVDTNFLALVGPGYLPQSIHFKHTSAGDYLVVSTTLITLVYHNPGAGWLLVQTLAKTEICGIAGSDGESAEVLIYGSQYSSGLTRTVPLALLASSGIVTDVSPIAEFVAIYPLADVDGCITGCVETSGTYQILLNLLASGDPSYQLQNSIQNLPACYYGLYDTSWSFVVGPLGGRTLYKDSDTPGILYAFGYLNRNINQWFERDLMESLARLETASQTWTYAFLQPTAHVRLFLSARGLELCGLDLDSNMLSYSEFNFQPQTNENASVIHQYPMNLSAVPPGAATLSYATSPAISEAIEDEALWGQYFGPTALNASCSAYVLTNNSLNATFLSTLGPSWTLSSVLQSSWNFMSLYVFRSTEATSGIFALTSPAATSLIEINFEDPANIACDASGPYESRSALELPSHRLATKSSYLDCSVNPQIFYYECSTTVPLSSEEVRTELFGLDASHCEVPLGLGINTDIAVGGYGWPRFWITLDFSVTRKRFWSRFVNFGSDTHQFFSYMGPRPTNTLIFTHNYAFWDSVSQVFFIASDIINTGLYRGYNLTAGYRHDEADEAIEWHYYETGRPPFWMSFKSGLVSVGHDLVTIKLRDGFNGDLQIDSRNITFDLVNFPVGSPPTLALATPISGTLIAKEGTHLNLPYLDPTKRYRLRVTSADGDVDLFLLSTDTRHI